MDKVYLPAEMVPSFRSFKAIKNGVEKNLLFKTWGGIGDQICAEPTLRFALKSFKGCDVSLASEQPELFSHLEFKRVFDLRKERPIYEKYFCFETIVPPTHLTWEFFSHMITNCVDFPSLCALRCQLPVADREVVMVGSEPAMIEKSHKIFVHPGRHWQSKTFPKSWWDEVLFELISCGATPVIIGANTDDNRGTVDVSVDGCLDLRNKLSARETIWMLHHARVLLTNDSAPLHMAVCGKAWIGFIATCKHPDFITHWRRGQWGWRMQNFGKGGVWDLMDYCPNKEQDVTAESVPEDALLSWLPDPKDFAHWAVDKASCYT